MNKLNLITRWKIQLDSDNHLMHTIALLEIVEMLNNLDEENAEDIYILLINSDICHFLSTIMSYTQKNSMSLINKITCHLSEIEEFYKNDFYRIIKSYLRVINSFSQKINSKYEEDIITCATIVLKRARERDCNFNDNRFSLNSCVHVLSSISNVHFNNTKTLDFTIIVIEIMMSIPASNENDQEHRNERLHETIKKLNTTHDKLESPSFIFLTSKILYNTIDFIPFPKDQQESHKIALTIVDKFLAIMEFTFKYNKDLDNDCRSFEVFCNIFYALLKCEKLMLTDKFKLLNYFFVSNGHHRLISKIVNNQSNIDNDLKKTPSESLKARVVSAEVINVFLNIMNGALGNEECQNHKAIREKSYEIVFKTDFKRLKAFSCDGKSNETTLLYLIITFIDFIWKKPTLDSAEILSNVSLIFAVNDAKNVALKPSVLFTMASRLFTSSFLNLTIKDNNLLKISSNSLLKSIENVKQIDLSYLRWWAEMGKPPTQKFNSVLLKFLNESNENQLEEQLQINDNKLFNERLLMKSFLNQSTKIGMHNNLKIIFCDLLKINSPNNFKRMLQLFERIRSSSGNDSDEKTKRLINFLDVINSSINNIKNLKMLRFTVSILMKVLKDPLSNQHLKVFAIEITKNLIANSQNAIINKFLSIND